MYLICDNGWWDLNESVWQSMSWPPNAVLVKGLVFSKQLPITIAYASTVLTKYSLET